MSIRPYVLKETNWESIKKTKFEIAILPWGATEAHNYHLPYGTDFYHAEEVAVESVRLAWEKGVKAITLPPVPFGVNTQQIDIPLTINLNPSTQAIIINDVVECLEKQGIRKLVIINGHGGNDFKFIIREQQKDTSVFLCQINWFEIKEEPGLFAGGGDHANEMETSIMLHLFPNLVLLLETAGDGKDKKFKIKGLREGWAWSPREWTKVTEDTGVGNPKQATALKGQKYFKSVTEQIANFINELANADPTDMYE